MKKAAIYARVSTPDQHIESQLYDLRKLAMQRGFEIVREYCDRGISGTKAKRPGLDSMMADARRGEFSVVLVAAFDRIARSTKNFLEIVDELDAAGIEFISAREAIDTSGPMGRMFITLIGSIAELERSLIVERIKAGMRRAKLEGQKLGRTPLKIDRDAIVRDRLSGMSLTLDSEAAQNLPGDRRAARSGSGPARGQRSGVNDRNPISPEDNYEHRLDAYFACDEFAVLVHRLRELIGNSRSHTKFAFLSSADDIFGDLLESVERAWEDMERIADGLER